MISRTSMDAECLAKSAMRRSHAPRLECQCSGRGHDSKGAAVEVGEHHARVGNHCFHLFSTPTCGPTRPLEAASTVLGASSGHASGRMRDHLQRSAPLIPQTSAKGGAKAMRVKMLPRSPRSAGQCSPDVNALVVLDEGERVSEPRRRVEVAGDSAHWSSTLHCQAAKG